MYGCYLLVVIFRCRNCGTILFRFSRVGQDFYGLPTPEELRARIGGKCPICGTIPIKPTADNVLIMSSRSQMLRYLRSSIVLVENINKSIQDNVSIANV